MRVGLITTLNTNIGDDLIREGICLIVREVFKGEEIDFVYVNKHEPLSVYPRWHPLRLVQLLTRVSFRSRNTIRELSASPSYQSLIRLLSHCRSKIQQVCARPLYRFGFSRFDNCDLIVQCGTPVVWPSCSKCEWAEPLWHQVVGRVSQKGIPVLNLGAGSCYPWEKQPEHIADENDGVYLRRILGYCRTTTVRDRLAQLLFEGLGYSCPLIPCPSLVASRVFSNNRAKGGLLVVSYMEKGGHYDLGQNIDPSAWRTVIEAVVARFRKYHELLFLCHNEKEYKSAYALDPTVRRFLPKNSREYFSVLSHASAGLCNRLHAGVALASIGVPTVCVGTDTRLLMIEAVGLPFLYVKEVSVAKLEEALHHLLTNRERERERLLTLQQRTWESYLELIKKTL